MDSIEFIGAIPAMPTPFEQGRLELKAFQQQVSRLAATDCSGIVVAGSTGEGSSLDPAEYDALVACACETLRGALPVIAGVGTTATHKALHLARQAMDAGADALLVTTPYYVRASEEGVCRHYEAIAAAVDLPILLYNVPGRTGFNISVEAIARLYAAGAIVGMKEAGSNLSRVHEIFEKTGSDFWLLSGDDYAALEMRRRGGHGCISVVANVVPEICASAHRLCDGRNYIGANALFAKLEPLQESLFLEPNPQGVKYAMHRLGLCRNELRLPLLSVSRETAARIDKAMQLLTSKYCCTET